MRITEPVNGIYKFEVAFEDIYTAVFAVRQGDQYLLIDSATTPADADAYILPALREIGLGDRAPAALLLTHSHGDHAGGTLRLSEHFPSMPIRSLEKLPFPRYSPLHDGEIIAERMQVIHLPGHTLHSVGYLDLQTGTLLSGDCLQQRGVSRYTKGVRHPTLYLTSIERIRQLDLSRIIASHDYVPLGCEAIGKEAIDRYLDECIAACPR